MVPQLAKFDISLKNTPPVWRHFVQKVGRGFLRFFGYSFMSNQIRRSYKNEEFDWLFDFVTVT